ncbi:hypothetical protein LFZ8_08800 [Salmonella enterica subsp. enterica serovar Djakarta str. S-1087]|nr:hypothetical protein LFZ8_08800 [Salmonella enterica subsp. enterica serovar Djakarta str. S-1087]
MKAAGLCQKNTPVDPVGIIDRTYGKAENTGQANASK